MYRLVEVVALYRQLNLLQALPQLLFSLQLFDEVLALLAFTLKVAQDVQA